MVVPLGICHIKLCQEILRVSGPSHFELLVGYRHLESQSVILVLY